MTDRTLELELAEDVAELAELLERHRLTLELEPGLGGGEPWLAVASPVDHPLRRRVPAARGRGPTLADAIGDLLPRLRAYSTITPPA